MANPVAGPAHAYAAVRDWPGYFAAVLGKGPRSTLLKALELFDAEASAGWLRRRAGDAPAAVDLACGEGRDTVELLRRGWMVWAIDEHPEAIARLRARADLVSPDRLRTRRSSMEDGFIPSCRLVNASFALPFCAPSAFPELWARIVSSLPPGGRFCGQFFGERDSWASLPDRTHHTAEQVRRLLAEFHIEHWEEEEKDTPPEPTPAKHWHVFHVVARKAGAAR